MTSSLLSGFGSYFTSEAVPGTLPLGQNSPQNPPHNLYPEQINGAAFTAPRHKNLRSWLYRILPAVCIGDFTPYPQQTLVSTPFTNPDMPPTALRWLPLPAPSQAIDFIDSLYTVCGNGSVATHSGAAVHLYACNRSMTNKYFYNADGDLLIVPQSGRLQIKTEMGLLEIAPKQIALIPRGIKFQVDLLDACAHGYVCENHGAPFILPELGPIGANGLANPRDFIAPNAWYENKNESVLIIAKFQSRLWQAASNHSPLNVVAWHGNYTPYCYDLTLFNTINTVSFDHPDPSIFTVLTSPSTEPGTANLDFVIFPERWMVAEHTFRPPYYHRNLMSECMGLIHGRYDAKATGFQPGGLSIHNAFTGHGPDTNTFHSASHADLTPVKYQNTLAFMFETRHVWSVTQQAMQNAQRDQHYTQCWQTLTANFSK